MLKSICYLKKLILVNFIFYIYRDNPTTHRFSQKTFMRVLNRNILIKKNYKINLKIELKMKILSNIIVINNNNWNS